jgi:hypothetical protein
MFISNSINFNLVDESMAKKELFIKRVHDIVNELKIPMIDKRVYDRVEVQEPRAIMLVRFLFEEDESVIRGFLTLAEYYRTVVVAQKETFYIAHDNILFKLESK